MTFQSVLADEGRHVSPIRELFWEYPLWPDESAKGELQVCFEFAEMPEDDMKNLTKFMPQMVI